MSCQIDTDLVIVEAGGEPSVFMIALRDEDHESLHEHTSRIIHKTNGDPPSTIKNSQNGHQCVQAGVYYSQRRS
jgi:hypothetical protein